MSSATPTHPSPSVHIGLAPVEPSGPGTVLDGAPRARGASGRARAFLELGKPRIAWLVTLTSAVGFVLAACGREWTLPELLVLALGCIPGTMLSAMGANALNQWFEWERDARMHRTAHRPLPSGRLQPPMGLAAGLAYTVLGVGLLAALCGLPAAAVAGGTVLAYIGAYTPLKPVTTKATLVGAVPGALPPLIGWAAGHAHDGWNALLQPGGWSLVALMFVWQLPHFLAIAWMYREDYARGGFRMLPLLDPTMRRTARSILLWSLAFVPAALLPIAAVPERLGWLYGAVAVTSGAAFAALGVRLARTRTREGARRVFLASVLHLPVLLGAMVVDALLHSGT